MYTYKPSTLPNSRIDIADILRGIAIAGIILIHFMDHMNLLSYPEPSSAFMENMDKIVSKSTIFLLGGKMYAIFAMLFGLSFFIQHDNLAKKGIDFRPRFAWRMILLCLFGMFDLLFYSGDILFMYGICGLLILPMIRTSDKFLIGTAILLGLQPVELVYTILGLINPDTPALNLCSRADWWALQNAQATGSIIDVAARSLRHGLTVNFWWAIDNGKLTHTIFLFLTGIILGRKRLFYNEGNNLVIWKRILTVSLVALTILIPGYHYMPKSTEVPSLVRSLESMFALWRNFAMMTVIVSVVVLLFYKTSSRNWLLKIAPYGRMSLTNYLTQSIFGAMLFYNWGFGLYRNCGRAESWLIGAAFVVMQFLLCRLWMQKHKRGPLENLWRKATWIGKK